MITYLNNNAGNCAGVNGRSRGTALRRVFLFERPPGARRPGRPVTHVLKKGDVESRVMHLKRRNGGEPESWWSSTGRLREKTGEITGAVLWPSATSPLRQKLEQELQKMSRRSPSGHAGGIAHDFNNLLTAVLANTSILRKRSQQDEKTQRMFCTHRESRREGRGPHRRAHFFQGGEPVKKSASVSALLKGVRGTDADRLERPVHHNTETPEAELWPLSFGAGQMSQCSTTYHQRHPVHARRRDNHLPGRQ